LKPGEHLIADRDIDPDSYETLLRARVLIQGRGLQRLTESTALLEQIVARHPGYAPAWLDLARAYNLTPNASPERNGSAAEFRRVTNVFMPKANAAAQRAIESDPGFALAYAFLAGQEYDEGRPLQAETYMSRAVALDPSSSAFLSGKSERLASLGHLKEALVLRERLQALEPFIPVISDVTAVILWANGKNDEAIEMAKSLPPNRQGRLAMIYASMGRFREAADILQAMHGGGVNVPAKMFVQAARLLRTAPTQVEAPEELPELGSVLSWVYLYVGARDRVLGSYEGLLEGGRLPGQEMIYLWHPSYAPVRKTERFKAFMRKAGFVAYWRAKGWPDLCHPIGADDFACE
jgi:tetratricopeptide (TPR) repeat protein